MHLLPAILLLGLSGAALIPDVSSAAELTFGVKASMNMKVEAGLDDRTRALIASLPNEVRVQVLKLLEEALPLIDKSVESYLDRVNEILEVQVSHLGCVASGSGKSIVDDLAKIFGGTPQPIAKLKKQAENLRTAFKLSSSPNDFRVAYADFLRNGNVTACSVAAVPEAIIITNELRADASARSRLWNRLYYTGCTDARACLSSLITTVRHNIDNAEAQDRNAVDARQRFDKIDLPKAPGFMATFRQADYEERIAELYDIQDGVNLVKEVRLTIARQYLALGKASIEEAKKKVLSGQASLSATSGPPNTAAIALVAGVAGLLSQANGQLDEAVNRDASLTPEIAGLREMASGLGASAAHITTTATANINEVQRVIEAAKLERAIRNADRHPGGRWHQRD